MKQGRPLTASERQLLLLLGGVLFVVANLFLIQWLTKLNRETELDLARLRIEKINADQWLGERDTWQARKTWLESKQPPLIQAGALAEMLKSSAGRYEIKIESQELQEPIVTKHYVDVTVRMKVNATLEGLVRWLVELQQPDLFQVVTHLSLKSDKEKPESRVSCELHLSRRCAPSS